MRGCLTGLVAFVVAVAAYSVVLRPYLDTPVHLILPVVGVLFAMPMVSALAGRVRRWRDLAALRDAEAYAAPVNGRLTAVIGTLSPQGLPLRSPVSDRPCVAYEYEIGVDSSSSGRSRSRRVRGFRHGGRHAKDAARARARSNLESKRLYGGVALAPSAVFTAHGSVRLLSFPVLDAVPQERHTDAESWDRIAGYVERVPTPRQGLLSAMRGFGGVPVDAHGAVRLDFKYDWDKVLPEAGWCDERVIAPGTQVCAIGTYVASQRGITMRGDTGIRLLPGDAAAARTRIHAQTKGGFRTALILLLVSHGLIGGVAYLSATRYAHHQPEQQAATLIDLIGRGDQAGLALAMQRGADPNAMNGAGEAAVHVAPDEATVRTLAAGGANRDLVGGSGRTPLMLAVLRGQPQVAEAWLAAGATVNFARADGATALSDAEEAGDQETANVLRAAGGLCDHVNAERGRLLASASPEDVDPVVAAVQAYLEAVHRKDLARLRALTVWRPGGFFESVDFDVWRATRPAGAAGAQGYLNTQAATVTLPPFVLRGATGAASGAGEPSGEAPSPPIVWAYQLKRVGSDWKIAREWALPTAEDGGGAASSAPSAPAAAPEPGEELERPRQPPPRRP